MIDFKNISFISVIAIVAIIVMSVTEMNNGNNKVVITKQEELSKINENIGGQAFATKLNNDENKRDIINDNGEGVASCTCSGGGTCTSEVEEELNEHNEIENIIIKCNPSGDNPCSDCKTQTVTNNLYK